MANRLLANSIECGVNGMKRNTMRRLSTRSSNQRLRSVDVPNTNFNGQHLLGNNMIVTMSMEQNVASAGGAGRIAASRTRKISRTAALFDPSGIAIEVVCGSSVENHEEVLVDVVSNVNSSRRELSSSRTGGNLRRSKALLKKQNALLAQKVNQCDKAFHTTELRAKLSFLQEEQFEHLLRYNVQQPKDMLNLTLLQLISIGIRMDQLERIIAMINENCMDLSEFVLLPEHQNNRGVESKTNANCYPVQSTANKVGENVDDDEDRPLVIDETVPYVDEQSSRINSELRSVDDIEKSLALVRHAKIPKSCATISEIRTELSNIVADLNANEAQIVKRTHESNQNPLTSTRKQLKTRSIKPAKWAKKATKPAGRISKKKSIATCSSSSTDSNEKHQTNNGSQSAVEPQLVATGPEPSANHSQKRGLHSVPTSPMNLENFSVVHTPADSEASPPIIDNKKPTFGMLILTSKDIKASHELVKRCNAKSVVVRNNLAPKENAVPFGLNSNPECSSNPDIQSVSASIPSGASYINLDSTIPQGNLELPTKTDVDIGEIGVSYVNETNTTATTSERSVLPADFSNDPNLLSTTEASSYKACTKSHVPAEEIQPGKSNLTSPTKTASTKIKGFTRVVSSKNNKNLKSISAALSRGELQLKQPTVLLTKLNPYSFPLAALKQGSKVDADSTTATCVEMSTSCSNRQVPEKQLGNETEKIEKTITQPQKIVRQKRLSYDTNSGQQTSAEDEGQRTKQVQSGAGNILLNNSSCQEMESSTRRESLTLAAFNDSQELDEASINAAHPSQKQEQKINSNRNAKPDLHKKEKQVVVQDFNTRCNMLDSKQDVSQNVAQVGATMYAPCTPDRNSIDITEQSITESSNICDSNNKPLQEALCTSYNSLSDACIKLKPENTEITAKRRKSLEEEPVAIESPKYDCNDVDMVVTITSPPMSPMSSGIASPTNLKAKLNDYTPAVEIDGHLSYPPMLYILNEVDGTNVEVNKPAGLDALLCSSILDPRLEKYNKKTESEVQLLPSEMAIQHDPRRHNRHIEPYSPQLQQALPQQTPNMLLYGCLHRSPWYQSLMSTMKIQINQAISVLVRAINNFQKVRLEMPYAVFDIFKLYCAGELLEILDNLGLFVDANGVISERKISNSIDTHSYGGSALVNATYSFIQPNVSTPVNTPPTRPNTPHTSTPFVSCYIESPPVPVNTPPPSVQRRHCGLKAPYIPRASNKSPSAPVARQLRYEECWDDEEDQSQTNTNNNGYSRHYTSRVYPRGERSREYRVSKTFGYRNRY